MRSKQKLNMLFFLLMISGLKAQQAIISSGGSVKSSNGSLSYTIGSFAYQTYSNANGSITEGVQQPFEISTVLGIDLEEVKLQLKAFPNPTIENLTLSVGDYINENLSYKLYDIQGKFIQQEDFETNKTVISMLNLPAGAYLLSVYDKNRLMKIFKIIKN